MEKIQAFFGENASIISELIAILSPFPEPMSEKKF